LLSMDVLNSQQKCELNYQGRTLSTSFVNLIKSKAF
jgi:hypothetical protein